MKENRKNVAEILNRSNIIAHVSMTGGGTSFIGEYLSFGGASATLVGAEVPYHFSKIDEFLGQKPFDKYCSKMTARQMAAKSYQISKSSEMMNDGWVPVGIVTPRTPIGIGVTCSLATGKGERAGRENKAFICIHSENLTSEFSIQFFGQRGERQYQEDLVVDYIFSAIITFMKSLNSGFVENPILKHLNRLQPHVVLSSDSCEKRPQTIEGNLKRFLNLENIIVMSGSFNPFHAAHQEMFETCKKLSYGLDKSILIVEVASSAQGKMPVDHLTIRDRITDVMAQTGHVDVVYSDTPFFVDKCKEYNKEGNIKVIFTVGYDTYARIRDFKYEEGSHENFFANKGIKPEDMSFLVFPRDGKTYCGEDPYVMKDSFKIPLSEHHELSSTQIRNK